MRLNHNMQSLSVLKNYKQSIKKNCLALDKVSTGSKINSAKDNPIKLAQSESIRMQIRGLQAAERNLQDGTSMIQTADSAMGTVSEALIRMKELTVQAGNGSYTTEDKKTIQNEIDQLKDYINQTAKNTEFNGNNLIGNDLGYKEMQAGANIHETIRIPFFNVGTEALGLDGVNLDVTDSENIDKALENIDKAIVTVNAARSKYGSIQQRMETTADNLVTSNLNLERADSNLRDADVAFEMAEFSRTSILKDTATAMLVQTNNFPKEILSILEKVK